VIKYSYIRNILEIHYIVVASLTAITCTTISLCVYANLYQLVLFYVEQICILMRETTSQDSSP